MKKTALHNTAHSTAHFPHLLGKKASTIPPVGRDNSSRHKILLCEEGETNVTLRLVLSVYTYRLRSEKKVREAI